MKTTIVSVINTKGGVGKTVTTVHLGAALAQAGHEVLLLDMDLQHGLTNYLDVEIDEQPTMSDVLLKRATMSEATRLVREKLSIVPATMKMEETERQLSSVSGGEVRLRLAMKAHRESGFQPDFVFADCPSGWGMVSRNAVLASDAFIVPINSEPAAYENAGLTIAAVADLDSYHERNTQLLGVLLTCYRQTNPAQAVESASEQEWGKTIFTTRIRRAEKVNELAITRKTMSDVRKRQAGGVGADYAALAGEVIARCQTKTQKRQRKAVATN
jgi:chromosome partitioning protein